MNVRTVFLLFPHQLFSDSTLLQQADEVYLVEEYLFFRQYSFHKMKLLFHRAGMRYLGDELRKKKLAVRYVEALQPDADIRWLIRTLSQKGVGKIMFYDVCDYWLERRISTTCVNCGIVAEEHPSPGFLNTRADLAEYFGTAKKYHQTDFYIRQRKRLNLLLDEQGKPLGGQWTYDTDNRQKYPPKKKPPELRFPERNAYYLEAEHYVEKHFASNNGNISRSFVYPVTHADSRQWLEQFLEQRFSEFGPYEDAIVSKETVLHHSVLSPLLNAGLLEPKQVVDAAVNHARNKNVALNSLEGFIRQIVGWREFIRGVYIHIGSRERTANFWQFSRPLPDSFYRASTGILPLDDTIRKVLDTGYCHHIERLMVLGNFMLLTETDPHQVYRWFMELFIDAYDWVMVPNVYGMSQFADGGLMATKPYISGSNYLLKMSDYKKAPWCEAWDALFWRFMDRHRQFFSSNPRLGMLLRTYDRMTDERKKRIGEIAHPLLGG
jgi:deoxyribodipyrimidine photolyase-related protein